MEPLSTSTIPYGVGSTHEVPPTPVTSPPAGERPPDAQEAKAAEATTVMAMQLTLFI